jgi:hypothetical protein
MKKLIFSTTLLALLSITALSSGCKDDPVDPAPEKTAFALHLNVNWGNSAIVLSQPYTTASGRKFKIDAFKLYLDDLSLKKPDGSFQLLNDIALVDLYKPASQTITGEVPAGDYTGIRFGIGIDSVQNHTDPASYDIAHPMSSTTGMYWSWFTQYIFCKIEGSADTTGGFANRTFLYHTGTDELFRTVELPISAISIAEGDTLTKSLTLDLEQVMLNTSNPIDVETEFITHTTDDMPLATKVTTNLMSAFRE